MSLSATPRRAHRVRSALLRVLVLPAVSIVVAAGVWVAGGVVSDDFRVSMVLTGAWFGLAGAASLWIAARHRAVRLPVLAGYALTVATVGGYLAVSTLDDRVVDERVVTGLPAPVAPAAGGTPAPAGRPAGPVEVARGRFASLEHETRGTAAVVRLPDGRRFLTLTRFATDAGPDLRVRLVPGGSPDGGADGAIDLGSLKGNRGDQQYRVPADAAVRGHAVVIWCRAFSAAFGSARLASPQ